jgi:hypothetical protein
MAERGAGAGSNKDHQHHSHYGQPINHESSQPG